MDRTSYFTGFPLNQNQSVYVEDVIRQLGDLYTDTEEILDTTIIARDQAVASAQSATSSENIAVTARDDALVAKQEAQDAAYDAEQERLQAQQAAADAEGFSQAAANSASDAADVLDQVTNIYGDATEFQDAVATAVDAKDEAVQAKDATLYALDNAEAIYGDTAALQLAVTQAENARDASQDAKTLAEKWASEAEDVPVVPGQFSAKHWAAKASEELGQSALKNQNLSDLTNAAEARSNLGTFSTVADVQSRNIPPVLDSIRTEGYYDPGDGGGALYKRVASEPSHAGKIQSADGTWWEIGKQPSYNAAQFGFRVTNSAADNQTALNAMLDVAQGNPCYVDAESDFECSSVQREFEGVDITFRGSGRWLRTGSGTIRALSILSGYDNIQTATLAKQDTPIHGSPSRSVKISVSDASGYSRGDVIKVVSDDQDLDANVDRRLGEFAEVIKVDYDTNDIWTADALEDYDSYVTNVRVGRLIKTKTNVRGLRVLASEDGPQGLVTYFRALYRPYLDIEIEKAPWICVNLAGCYGAELHFRGSGKGDSGGSLGYGVSDISGKDNVIYPRGKHFRHLTTTNFDSTEAGSDSLQNYGATRGHTVINGFAEGSQGAPFDDHPGARGTRWINCKAVASVTTSSSTSCAFQARGRDAEIINPWVDSSHEAVLRHHILGRGTTYIRGGKAYCKPVHFNTELPDPYPDLVIDGLYSDSDVVVLFDLVNVNLVLRGGLYINRAGAGHRRIVSAGEGVTVRLEGPEFRHEGTGENFRFIRVTDESAKVYGSFKAVPGIETPYLFSAATGVADAFVQASAFVLSGSASVYEGTFNNLRCTVYNADTDTVSGVDVANLDDLRKVLGSMS